jgi:hypothetical protein
MFVRGVIGGFFMTGILLAAVTAEELQLPAGVVNVVLPEFGNRIGPGSDYGLANVEPVEVGWSPGRGQEIRIVRTSQELRLSRQRNEARFQVRLGAIEGFYFWIETPPVYADWHVTLSVVYPDGYQEPVFSADILPEGIHFAQVPRRTLLEVQVSSIEQTFKSSKWFIFTVSPVYFALWPDLRPIPYQRAWGG